MTSQHIASVSQPSTQSTLSATAAPYYPSSFKFPQQQQQQPAFSTRAPPFPYTFSSSPVASIPAQAPPPQSPQAPPTNFAPLTNASAPFASQSSGMADMSSSLQGGNPPIFQVYSSFAPHQSRGHQIQKQQQQPQQQHSSFPFISFPHLSSPRIPPPFPHYQHQNPFQQLPCNNGYLPFSEVQPSWGYPTDLYPNSNGASRQSSSFPSSNFYTMSSSFPTLNSNVAPAPITSSSLSSSSTLYSSSYPLPFTSTASGPSLPPLQSHYRPAPHIQQNATSHSRNDRPGNLHSPFQDPTVNPEKFNETFDKKLSLNVNVGVNDTKTRGRGRGATRGNRGRGQIRAPPRPQGYVDSVIDLTGDQAQNIPTRGRGRGQRAPKTRGSKPYQPRGANLPPANANDNSAHLEPMSTTFSQGAPGNPANYPVFNSSAPSSSTSRSRKKVDEPSAPRKKAKIEQVPLIFCFSSVALTLQNIP